jgi:hypothetical protein
MISALLATLLLFPAGDDSRIEPLPVHVRKRNGQWELRLKVRSDFPDGTILSVHVQPRILKYLDSKQVLVWHEPLSAVLKGRALIRRKHAELRINLPRLQSIRITYAVNPMVQRNGLELKRPVTAVQDPFRAGSVVERLKQLESGYDYTRKLSDELAKLISQLDRAAKGKDPGRAIRPLAHKVIRFRDKCRRRLMDGACAGTVGFIDMIAGDVIMLCSWLGRKNGLETQAGGGGGSDDQGPENAPALDDPEGENQGGSGGSPSGLKDKGAGNIRTERFSRLEGELEIVPSLHRAETILLLLVETRSLLEEGWEKKKFDSKRVAALAKTVDLLLDKPGMESLSILTRAFLKRACEVLRQAAMDVFPSAEEYQALIDALEAEEKKSAKVSS